MDWEGKNSQICTLNFEYILSEYQYLWTRKSSKRIYTAITNWRVLIIQSDKSEEKSGGGVTGTANRNTGRAGMPVPGLTAILWTNPVLHFFWRRDEVPFIYFFMFLFSFFFRVHWTNDSKENPEKQLQMNQMSVTSLDEPPTSLQCSRIRSIGRKERRLDCQPVDQTSRNAGYRPYLDEPPTELQCGLSRKRTRPEKKKRWARNWTRLGGVAASARASPRN